MKPQKGVRPNGYSPGISRKSHVKKIYGYMNKTMSKTKNCFKIVQSYAWYSMVKMFALQKYDYDRKYKHILSVCVTVIICSFFGLSSVAFVAMSAFYSGAPFIAGFQDKELIRFIISTTAFIFTTVLLLVYIALKYMQIWLYGINTILIAVILLIHYTSYGRIVEGTPISSLVLVSFMSIVFGNKLNSIIWVLISVISYLSCLIIDVLMFDFQWYCALIQGYSTFGAVVMPYFASIIPVTVAYVIIYSFNKRINSTRKLTTGIGDAILFLDLDNEQLTPLLTKDDKNCNSTELLLKGIVNNLKTYKRFIPSHVYDPSMDEGSSNNRDSSSTDSSGSNVSMCSSTQLNDVIHAPSMGSRLINFGLNSKSGIILTACLNILIDEFSSFTLSEIRSIFNSFIDIVQKTLAENKGSVDTFFQNYIFCSFGTGRICMTPKLNALRTAILIKDRILKEIGITVTCIISYSDSVIFGNLLANNTTAVRTVMTGCCERMIKYYRSLDIKNAVIVDRFMRESGKFTYLFKQVGLFFEKRTTVKLFKLVKSIQKGNSDEWIYELESYFTQKQDDDISIYESAWSALEKRKLQMATELTDEYSKKTNDPDYKLLLKNIKRVLNESSEYDI